MELDLNQEPPNESMFGLQSLLSELESAHGCIDERIRQLEAVISRARQRQIWRQNQTTPQTPDVPTQATASEVPTVVPIHLIQPRISNERNIVKKNNIHLVAKALGRDLEAKKTKKDKGGFFDCNICLDMAIDPILTSCGHLFCWPCFYSCSHIGFSDMECPVCMEKIMDKNIIPIYGNGNGTNTQKSRFEESGFKIPPRPNAHRIEGLRQKLTNLGAVSPLTFRNTQLPNIIAAAEGSPHLTTETPRSWDSRYVRDQLMQTMLEERSASFSSLSNALNSAMSSVNSAMSSAARLIQDLEASISSHRTSRQALSDFERDSISSIAAIIEQDSQNPSNAAEIDSSVAQTVSPSTNSDTAFVELESLRMNPVVESNPVMPVSSSSSRRAELSRNSEVSNSVEVNSSTPNSSSSRRRRGVPVNSDVENDGPRYPIRRRLM